MIDFYSLRVTITTMTKTIELGNDRVGRGKTPIKFVSILMDSGKFESVKDRDDILPSEFDNLELICRDYAYDKTSKSGGQLDLIFGFRKHRQDFSCLFLGKWNDGVV